MKRFLQSVAFAAALFAGGPVFAASADPCAAPTPDTPLKGTVSGRVFVPNDVTVYKSKTYGNDGTRYDSYYLTFRDGIGYLQVQTIVKPGSLPDRRTFRRLPTRDPKQQPMAGPEATEVQSWYLLYPPADIDTGFIRDLAVLRLEFGKRIGARLPGHLALCIPRLNAVILGAFDATIQKQEK